MLHIKYLNSGHFSIQMRAPQQDNILRGEIQLDLFVENFYKTMNIPVTDLN
jgi:hypothetical protein